MGRPIAMCILLNSGVPFGGQIGSFVRALLLQAVSFVLSLFYSSIALVQKSPTGAVVSVVLTAAAIVLGLRFLRPRRMLVVGGCEIPSRGGSDLEVSGKTVANLLADQIQAITNDAREHDTRTGRPRTSLRSEFALATNVQLPQIGVEVGGFSFDRVKAEVQRLRYSRFLITADVIEEKDKFVLVARAAGVGSWRTEPKLRTAVEFVAACDDIARHIMLAVAPELLGMSYLHRKCNAEALEAYAQACRRDPVSENAQIGRGVALMRMGRHEEAAEIFRAAASRATFPRALWLVYEKGGLRRLVHSRRSRGRALSNLSIVCARAKDLPQAISLVRKSLEAYKKNELAYYNLGLYLVRSGNVPDAISALESACKIAPRYEKATALLKKLREIAKPAAAGG